MNYYFTIFMLILNTKTVEKIHWTKLEDPLLQSVVIQALPRILAITKVRLAYGSP